MLEWSIGVEWSGVESDFGVKKWATLSAIQTKPGHNLENTKNIAFHSADLIDLYFWDNPAMAQN